MSRPSLTVRAPDPRAGPPIDAGSLAAPVDQVSYFSVLPGRELRPLDATALTPVAAPRLPADLNAGYPDDAARGKGVWHAARVDEVVAALVAAGVDVAALDVVTYRNNLIKVGGTPVSRRDGWCVDAVALKKQGADGAPPTRATVFLDIVHAAYDQTFPDADRFMYWGYAFESLAAAAGTGTAPAPARVGRSEFATVVTRRLGSLACAVAGETDGFDPTKVGAPATPPPGARWATHADRPIPPSSYIELKTLRWPEPHARGAAATLWNLKAAKWWWQAFVCGIGTVVLGGRDQAGMLNRVDAVAAAELPRLAASNGGRWTPATILATAHDITRFIVDTAREAEGVVLRFEYVPGGERGVLGVVRVAEVASDVVARVRGAGF